MITKTGADYAYIMDSFGPFVAFLRLWIECKCICLLNQALNLDVISLFSPPAGMIVRPCSQAIVALTFSFYVLRPIYPDCDPPADAVRYLACICIGKFCSSLFLLFYDRVYVDIAMSPARTCF